MRLIKRFMSLTMLSGLISVLLLSTGCSNSDEPAPEAADEPTNEMVAKFLSGELTGELTGFNSYMEEYDEASGEWHDMGVVYGKYYAPVDNFYISGGKIIYKVLIKPYPIGNTAVIKSLWDAYQSMEEKQIDLYVSKPFEIDTNTLVFKDFHNKDAKVAAAENNEMTIIFHEMYKSAEDGEGSVRIPVHHEVKQYTFTPCEAPDLTGCKVFGSINDAYQYVIKCARDNWEQIKHYMPEEYRDGVDFDALEKNIEGDFTIV